MPTEDLFFDELEHADPETMNEVMKIVHERLDKDNRDFIAYGGGRKSGKFYVGMDWASQPDETVMGTFEDPDSDYGVSDVYRFLDPETGWLWCVSIDDLVATLSYEKDDKFHIDRVKVWRDWSDRQRAIERLERLLTSRNTHWRKVR